MNRSAWRSGTNACQDAEMELHKLSSDTSKVVFVFIGLLLLLSALLFIYIGYYNKKIITAVYKV